MFMHSSPGHFNHPAFIENINLTSPGAGNLIAYE